MLRSRRPVAGAILALIVLWGSLTAQAMVAAPGPHAARHRVLAVTATADGQDTTIDMAQVAAEARGHVPATAPGVLGVAPPPSGPAVSVRGIPPVPLAAYRNAAALQARLDPGCHLPWYLLAGIGAVESGHAASGGSTRPGWDGVANPPIYGPLLDGSLAGTEVVRDTDSGRLDGNAQYDRAVGPVQFLPGTWTGYASDGDHDGTANPQDIYDETWAAGKYLCANGGDLSSPQRQAVAVYSYNPSAAYVREVLSLAAAYAGLAVPQFVGAPSPSARPSPSPSASASPRPSRSASPSPSPSARLVQASPQPAPGGGPLGTVTSPRPKPSPTLSPAPLPSVPTGLGAVTPTR